MKTGIFIVFAILAILYCFGIKINLKPFSIQFENYYNGFGVIFMILALVSFRLDSYNKGKKETLEKVFEILHKVKKK